MANQPKKYKKFVATAATATLVASAIVPVASAASFTDVPGDHEFNQYINELVEAGIIKGYPDGTFGLHKQLKRSDVVKMLGRYLEANGVEVPADWATVQRFSDVPVTAQDQELVKYAALVKDAGVFTGSNGKLNYTQNIQRQQMAKVLNNAYEKINGKSLIDLAAEIEDVKVADLDKAFDEFRPYIQALADLKITTVENFRPADAVTRGQFAKFLSISIKGGNPATPAEVQIESLTATGVSELTVKFNKAVDTEAAKFAVARGTTAITVKDVDWNDAKTEAVITVDHKFADATYTLTVSGLGEKDLTKSVTTTKEEVTKIEFLSNKLVLTGLEDRDGDRVYKQAVIAFAAYNQYGEDITKNVIKSRYKDPKVRGIRTASKGSHLDTVVENGRVVTWVEEREKEGEEGSVEFTYENGDYELHAYQDVVLSDIAEPGSVELLDIYNASGKALTTKNLEDVANDNEDFYLLFKVKDQYGVEIDPEFAKSTKSKASTNDTTILDEVKRGLRVRVSDRDIFELEDEENIEVLNVDGKYYFALEVKHRDPKRIEAGENTVEVRARATGEVTTKVYKVEASSEVYKIELLAPSEVVAGDEIVKLPVIATDINGEVIKNAAELNKKIKDGRDNGITFKASSSRIVGGDSGFRFVEENGQLYLEFKTVSNKYNTSKPRVEEVDIEVTVEKYDQDSEITLKIQPDAYAAKIIGVKDKADTYFHQDGKAEIKLKDLIIEDQYGRIFDDNAKLAKDPNFEIKLLNTENGIIQASGTIKNTSDKLTFTAKDGKKGSGTFELELTAKDLTESNKNVTDRVSITFRAVEDDDFTSYKVKSDGYVYGKEQTTQDTAGIEVYGVLSNGVEVEITNIAGAFQVLPGDYLTTSDVVDVKADVTSKALRDILDANGYQSVETGVRVVINATGEEILHKIVISDAPGKAASIKLKDSNSISEKELEVLEIKLTSNQITGEDILNALKAHNFEIKDQYGKKVTVDEITNGRVKFTHDSSDDTYDGSGVTLTISDVFTQNDNVKVQNNGRLDVKIGGTPALSVGDYFTVTIKVDGVSKSLRVKLVN
ncbi:S-layer homology domain-containing protein [Ureibacillus thermosphaericus]|uniref:SLH domain-containing protein n=1 Tax=Ureibacillus thermosphaericus TaxID=51173 RepID=A0A840Q025_URETH|nr:S-layer homology domain-containing protein [Ureibacillus thermosphaericus]MBB5149828.1 hypothetical protein [Ureibacillus thermosphaericus]NKZ32831.1 S-layer homology domain-containing protein [Ureibacillus thermosphaericus]